ncbi:MAG: D-glycerate 2-kinase [uncultured Thermomicrobiales bacterium]|uniref:D-glycerate 2-kinase n=1 Tax=uncultured Thermomicrobiales bacterium TaxID=1645740 RepID=A0A6J4U839_9BACT|nr:MAG: D-glycerate 2-kinase [uncultured Thermomicrobiales bacterium]
MSLGRADARSLIRSWYASGISAVEPRDAVRRHLSVRRDHLQVGGRSLAIPDHGLVLVAIGKAAVAMALGADDVLGRYIRDGIILTKDGHAEHAPSRMRVFEAAHPVPDERGVAASAAILETVNGLAQEDIVLTLLSGGGSALFEAPRDPLTLAEVQETTTLLLRAGAPIQDLNAVRSPLSFVKGGGFRHRIGAANCVSLILSDVLGNDPAVIASGPTIRTTPDPSRALALLDRYGVRTQVPRGVIDLLERQKDAREAAIDVSPADVFEIIADNDVFVDGVAEAAGESHVAASAWRHREGEARELGQRFVADLGDVPDTVHVVLGGGEATVTVRGDGKGGRNTEFALAAAIELDRNRADWVVASLASDGQDGSIDGAGAIADNGTVERAARMGLDASAYLERNDSGTFFEKLGDLVVPGPTGTNVNDVYIAVRATSFPGDADG